MVNGDEKPRLLVVDDDPYNLLLLRRTLEDASYHATCTQSGQEALALLSAAPYDVVLLDIMMPGMTGLQVLDILRRTPATTTLPVILISALTDSADIARGLEMGANDYITKPIDINVVPARINNQLTLKRLLDERNETIDQLRAAQAMRERFFRIATHDLKGPLANIRLAHHLLRGFVPQEVRAQEILGTLALAVETMQEVISDFLDSAALQSGKLDLKPICVDAHEIVWDVVMQYEPAAARKNIALQVGDVVGGVYADYARLAQVLGNLVSNAIKYSPSATTVRLWNEQRDGRCLLFIADQGPGIPQQERDRLFTEFARLSTRPTGGESSTGLGLWIVKHLVELHGGSVGVDCPPEGGSVFWVDLLRC